MANSLREAHVLTPFGAETRYPGGSPELLPGDEIKLLALADRVKVAVSPALQSYRDQRGKD
jgi:hypothetical protein